MYIYTYICNEKDFPFPFFIYKPIGLYIIGRPIYLF